MSTLFTLAAASVVALAWILAALYRRCGGTHWLAGHHWTYRNPADRTCKVCGRRENQFCRDYRDVFDRTKGWWEVMRPGDPSKHGVKKS